MLKENNIYSDLEEKSDLYLSVLNDPPKFYLRSGFGIIFSFLIIILISCYFIDYSDFINSEVKIVSSNPRVTLISPKNGRINNLIKNNELVSKGMIIASLDNLADLKSVLYIEKEIKIDYQEIVNKKFHVERINLGELQPSFSNFLKAKAEMEVFSNIRINKGIVKGLNNELSEGKLLINKLKEEKRALLEKLKLSENQVERYKILYHKGVVSLNDFEETKQKHIDVLKEFKSKSTSIKQYEIANTKTTSNITSTNLQDEEVEIRVKSSFLSSLNQLKSDIDIWKKNHLFIAPISGRFIMSNIWANEQTIKVGDEIGSILPQTNKVFAIAKMPEFEAGKVNTKSKVFINLNSYNYSQYGVVEGSVCNINPFPLEGFYEVQILLDKGLVTDLNYRIPFKPELSGEARIITEKMNLLERLFYKIKKLFSRQKNQLVIENKKTEEDKNDKKNK